MGSITEYTEKMNSIKDSIKSECGPRPEIKTISCPSCAYQIALDDVLSKYGPGGAYQIAQTLTKLADAKIVATITKLADAKIVATMQDILKDHE